MAVSFGKLDEFNTANNDGWCNITDHECMEHYFLTNDITDAAK